MQQEAEDRKDLMRQIKVGQARQDKHAARGWNDLKNEWKENPFHVIGRFAQGVGGGGEKLYCLVWLGVIWSNLLHVNLSEQQEPDYPSNNGHPLICQITSLKIICWGAPTHTHTHIRICIFQFVSKLLSFQLIWNNETLMKVLLWVTTLIQGHTHSRGVKRQEWVEKEGTVENEA